MTIAAQRDVITFWKKQSLSETQAVKLFSKLNDFCFVYFDPINNFQENSIKNRGDLTDVSAKKRFTNYGRW